MQFPWIYFKSEKYNLKMIIHWKKNEALHKLGFGMFLLSSIFFMGTINQIEKFNFINLKVRIQNCITKVLKFKCKFYYFSFVKPNVYEIRKYLQSTFVFSFAFSMISFLIHIWFCMTYGKFLHFYLASLHTRFSTKINRLQNLSYK